MEVSGIEGNFRFTCKNVMRVLREHRPSVMAMLEAFVYDPLINWRLLEATAVKPMPASSVEGSVNPGAAAGVAADAPPGLQGEDLVSMQRPTHHRSASVVDVACKQNVHWNVLCRRMCNAPHFVQGRTRNRQADRNGRRGRRCPE